MRRDDLQGVRGFSIIIVLLFHLFPKQFANGFAGVDIFFVLSGYLMTMMYSTKITDVTGFAMFYRKRLLRLLPMYAFVIVATLSFGHWLMTNIDYHYAKDDSFDALVMATNIRNLCRQLGYFDQINDFSFFMHTWSLAVEVQYYAFVPFFFYVCRRWSSVGSAVVNAISGASFMFAWFADDTRAFNSVFARIWQFQVGAISAQITAEVSEDHGYEKLPLVEKDEERECVKETSHIPKVRLVLCALLFALLLPEIPFLTQKEVRIYATLIAAVLFALPTENLCLFSTRFFTFFGDISYVLYLIHWPVILFCLPGVDSNFASTLCSRHFFLEKRLLTNSKASLIFTLSCYVTCGCLIAAPLVETQNREPYYPSINNPPYYWSKSTYYSKTWPRSVRIENAIYKHEYWYRLGWKAVILAPGCDPEEYGCKLQLGKSNLSVLAIGNSFAARAFPGLYEALKDRVGTLELKPLSAWEVLNKLSYDQFSADCLECEQILDYARYQETDILFIINSCLWPITRVAPSIAADRLEGLRFRYKHNFTDPIKGPLDKEPLMIKAVEELEKLSKTTKKIVLSGILRRFPDDGPNPMSRLHRWLHFNRNLSAIATYPYQEFLDQHSQTLIRMNYLVSKCPKCVYFDMQAPLCNAEKTECRTFDEESYLSYYIDYSHLSIAAVEKIMPSLKAFMDELLETI
ncbi:hypothetical protein QR680_014805 [Steinernema hermaphroditum]|uniref:Acyl_transf_3 domain-containing protein n=1 Tax=Steinernema hermaphroditum TaxID=289476 RepID=A0AA39ICT5_9BILA|nr:hypothetical protein QR680_014805 [Steinernema hermaphroditum]